MYEWCIKIKGIPHFFPIQAIIKIIHRPPPTNYPAFDVALAVKELAQLAPPSEFTKSLEQLAENFIEQMRKDLPEGLELVFRSGAQAA